MARPNYNRPLHLIALLTAAATFPLIFMGGLVTSHGAGMSVPDWPNSWGYNMFLFPPRLWIGGILYEHTHRLMGTVVGMLSIVLVIVAWRVEQRRWVRFLAASTLLAVIFQGVLGGLRVVLVKLDLAIVHACFAQAFFCLTALMAIVTSKWWMDAPDLSRSEDSAAGRRLIAACAVALSIVYLQLIAGAVMRHYEAGLAIPDFPLSYGKALPPMTNGALEQINARRGFNMNLPRVTLGQVWIHFAHRIGALAVSAAVIITATLSLRMRSKGFKPLVALLLLLLAAQITLGILTVLLRKPADVTSLHVAVGALVLVTCFVMTIRAMRLFGHRRMGFPVRQNDHALAPESSLAMA